MQARNSASRTLTDSIIKDITHQTDLSQIKELKCTQHKLANIAIASELTNVEILNFSFNHITSFKELKHCIRLRELHLHHNKIKNFGDFKYLKHAPLEVLTVSENPFIKRFSRINYRLEIIRAIPKLKILDNKPVTDVERRLAFEGVLPINDDEEDRQQCQIRKAIESIENTEGDIYAKLLSVPDGKIVRFDTKTDSLYMAIKRMHLEASQNQKLITNNESPVEEKVPSEPIEPSDTKLVTSHPQKNDLNKVTKSIRIAAGAENITTKSTIESGNDQSSDIHAFSLIMNSLTQMNERQLRFIKKAIVQALSQYSTTADE